MVENNEKKMCPRCRDSVLHSAGVYNAVSRIDNETQICSRCGLDESLRDHFGEPVWSNYPNKIKETM